MAATNGVEKLDFSTFSNVINGELTKTEAVRHGVNPANNEKLFPCPVSTQSDVDAAVKAARTAFQSWKKTSIEVRKEKIQAFTADFVAHKAEFSKLLTTEQGKPTQFADQELDFAAYWLAGTTQLDLPLDIVEDSPERHVETRYVPLGVAVGIVPWNFPVMLLCGKLAPAVMTGNCLIIKPSPFTPYCGIKIAELAQRHFPPGVIQVLSGDDNLGPWLTAHSGIDKISFTGSTATGKRVMESASRNLTRVTLELGGNDAAIVCSDVDVETAAPHLAQVAFMNSGQVCVAVKRVYVHEDIYDAFKAAFVKHLGNFPVGPGFEEGAALGPVQNKLQFDRVKEFLSDVKAKNQTVLTGGAELENNTGFFIQPTVVDNPPDDSKIVREEPFGPVVPLLKWSNVDEVISRANDTDMGLGSSVWTKDRELARKFAEELEAGSVWLNEHIAMQPTAAFGGHKKSGMGSEWGTAGLRGYCNAKTVFFK
ncbi:Aldehyde/histidinol dehydrogenase [Dactylonectria estremocensis]|uniref:aldehyde dehydrogenase (NAD(+)) n=1 Tax=Dactylonectria estremocensis TaxID=1079267 RepID=A0A9P9DWT8_9HYPO|nr:Aldehyde/histidinol dehydrogenase [Dactylonectria estremocensis]